MLRFNQKELAAIAAILPVFLSRLEILEFLGGLKCAEIEQMMIETGFSKPGIVAGKAIAWKCIKTNDDKLSAVIKHLHQKRLEHNQNAE